MKDYISFYKELLGFEPYDFQVKVAELLLQGKNVILSVPTGAGKTWASVMPFLYAWSQQMTDFPLQMIYSLPLRTLTNSIYTDIHSLLEKDRARKIFNSVNLASVQTGEYSEDPYFEKAMVFSTIDQTLSSFLSFPLSLSKRQANINAGAVIGSYLVFDEFHLLDSRLSMTTTLGMIRMLKNLCRVCIMTATLTDEYIQILMQQLNDFELVSLENYPRDKFKIKSLRPAIGKEVKKSVFISEDTIGADKILSKHQNKSIVICNRVETAQKIFLELQAQKSEQTKIICIHSRFFDSDRKHREQQIKEYFGKHSNKENVILVATQVIEAGMDISCDVMHTEISPVNSFLQRAGRCARFENEYGKIFVYDVISSEEKGKITFEGIELQNQNEIRKLNNRYLPYDEDLCKKSFLCLQKCSYLNEEVAGNLVNEVLTKDESGKVANIAANGFNRPLIEESWRVCDKKYYKNTIRDIQSIEIVLIDVEGLRNLQIVPWKYETISVYRWSFIGWAKKWMQNKKDDDDWILAKAEQGNDSSFDSDWNECYYLRALGFEDLKNHYDVVFIDNRYLDYNDAGLMVLNNENGFVSPVKEGLTKERIQIIFKKDTFYEHSKALLNCFEKEFKPYLKFAFQELDILWKKQVDWEKLIRVMMYLHDYGKLNINWQKPMVDFQSKKTGVVCREVLAHTDYDETTDAELAVACKIRSKPPHAGIGAQQIYDILVTEWGEADKGLARVTAYAVLKHHSVESESSVDFITSEYCIREVERLFEDCPLQGEFVRKKRREILNEIIPENVKEWFTYLFLVRLLRICDQRATESMKKYI